MSIVPASERQEELGRCNEAILELRNDLSTVAGILQDAICERNKEAAIYGDVDEQTKRFYTMDTRTDLSPINHCLRTIDWIESHVNAVVLRLSRSAMFQKGLTILRHVGPPADETELCIRYVMQIMRDLCVVAAHTSESGNNTAHLLLTHIFETLDMHVDMHDERLCVLNFPGIPEPSPRGRSDYDTELMQWIISSAPLCSRRNAREVELRAYMAAFRVNFLQQDTFMRCLVAADAEQVYA